MAPAGWPRHSFIPADRARRAASKGRPSAGLAAVSALAGWMVFADHRRPRSQVVAALLNIPEPSTASIVGVRLSAEGKE